MKKHVAILFITLTLAILTLTAVPPTTATNPNGGQNLTWAHYPRMEATIYGLAANGNDVWAATTGEGVIHWQKDTGANERFTTADGLANDTVYEVARDQSGILWFATANGLSRYDGTNWTTYDTSDGFPHPVVRAVYIHPQTGQVIAGAATGILVFDGTNWTALPNQPSIGVKDIVVDLDGDYWIADGENGVYKYDGSWTYFNNPNTGPGHDVTGIAVNPLNGDVWFSFEDEGVGRFSGSNYTTYTTANGLLKNQTNTIGVDYSGNVWVGHGNSPFDQNRGLSRFVGGNWITYGLDQGVPVCCIQSMAFNTNGDSWFGHFGATLFGSGSWSTYGTGPFVSTSGVDVGDNNKIWFGQYRRGAGSFDGQRWSHYSTYDGLGAYTVANAAVDANNQAWFVLLTADGFAYKGLNRVDGQTWHYYNEDNSNLLSNIINDVYPDSSGNTWFATPKGASKWNGMTFTSFTTANGLPSNKVVAVAAQDNDVWFAIETPSGEVVHYDGSTLTIYTAPGDLFYPGALDMDIAPNGDLWLVSTQSDNLAVSQFDGISWTHFTNLPNGSGARIRVDANNTPWVATSSGLLHRNGNSWDTYGISTGLPSNSFGSLNTNSARRTFWMVNDGFLQLHILTGLDNKSYLPILEGE